MNALSHALEILLLLILIAAALRLYLLLGEVKKMLGGRRRYTQAGTEYHEAGRCHARQCEYVAQSASDTCSPKCTYCS